MRVKRSCTFAAALRDKRETKRHVPRHIELTAVPMKIGTIIKESKRIGRFKKPLEFESNNNSLSN